MNYDVIIVGAGVAGTVAAQSLASKGKKVKIIEKRDHVGGNCYDEVDEHGILIHKYGPHIFHTNNDKVYSYLCRFTDFTRFNHEVLANLGDKEIPVPFNFNSIDMCFSEDKANLMKEELIREFPDRDRVPILELKSSNSTTLQELSAFIYENIFKYYTMKQWGLSLEELDPSVGARVPVVLSYKNGYFSDKYQGVPKNGFTQMFKNMLQSSYIDVELSKDAIEDIKLGSGKIYYKGELFRGRLIYTGEIDRLFNYEFGKLPYRTLDFKREYYDKEYFQKASVVNYTVSEDYTRITEYKRLTLQKDIKGTTIMKEYPRAYEVDRADIPYYAINNSINDDLYSQYLEKSKSFKGLEMLGRLAEYKYYNIDGMVERALSLYS